MAWKQSARTESLWGNNPCLTSLAKMKMKITAYYVQQLNATMSQTEIFRFFY